MLENVFGRLAGRQAGKCCGVKRGPVVRKVMVRKERFGLVW